MVVDFSNVKISDIALSRNYYIAVVMLFGLGICMASLIPEFDVPWRESSLYGGIAACVAFIMPMACWYFSLCIPNTNARSKHNNADSVTLTFTGVGADNKTLLLPGQPGLRTEPTTPLPQDTADEQRTTNPLWSNGSPAEERKENATSGADNLLNGPVSFSPDDLTVRGGDATSPRTPASQNLDGYTNTPNRSSMTQTTTHTTGVLNLSGQGVITEPLTRDNLNKFNDSHRKPPSPSSKRNLNFGDDT